MAFHLALLFSLSLQEREWGFSGDCWPDRREKSLGVEPQSTARGLCSYAQPWGFRLPLYILS